jgi:hypothetical protein
LDFNPAAPNEVAGQLLDPVTHQRVGTITGYRLVWSPGTPATSFAGFYTALMPLPSSLQGDQEIPQGTGTLSFIIAPTTGRLSMTAYSAEGVKYTCASLVGANGQLIFFAPLPTISSLLEGSATILPSSGDAFANNSLQGTLSWSKAAVASNSPSRLYRQGFGPIPLDLLGGKYAPPTAGQIIMNLPARVANPNAQLTFTQGGLLDSDISPLDFNLSNPSGATQKATLPTAGGPLNPGKVTFVLAATTGQFTGSITINHPVAALARKVSYQGRITHDSDGYHAGGFFLMPQLPQPGESLKTSPVLSGKAALSPLP